MHSSSDRGPPANATWMYFGSPNRDMTIQSLSFPRTHARDGPSSLYLGLQLLSPKRLQLGGAYSYSAAVRGSYGPGLFEAVAPTYGMTLGAAASRCVRDPLPRLKQSHTVLMIEV
jgi:hypothetical protein